MELPFEILALVFKYLPTKDIDTVQLVCRSWRDIASDKVWKQQFLDKFGTDRICPVSPQFTAWRRELLLRNQVLHKWRKCSKQTDLTLNSTLTDNTEIFCNFSSDLARAVCFNSHTGSGNIIELDRGKIKRKLYASRYNRETLPVSAIDGSRFGMVYGFLDGTVTTVAFSKDGSIASDFRDLPYKHETAVTSVWIAKSRNFLKQANNAISVATGGFDGTVSLSNPQGHEEFRPEMSPVVLLEGSLYGSYAADDGDSLVALYKNGAIYRFSSSGEAIKLSHLAQLPLDNEEIDASCQLHLCNNYVVLQRTRDVHVVDMATKVLVRLDIPSDAKITAFAIDKSRTPGTKMIAGGLSSNCLCVWELPALESANTADGQSPRLELVNLRPGNMQKPGQAAISNKPNMACSSIEAMFNSEERRVATKALWTSENPIGYESRLTEGNKPQITKLALNSVILLVAGYNGMVHAVDVLSGRPLKRISSRISKNVLDFARYSRDGFVPVTHLEIDPDPLKLRAIMSVRPAIQYLDLGCIGISKTSSDKKKGSKHRHRNVNLMSRHDLEEDIELGDSFALADAEREDRNIELVESFGFEGLDPDEQVAYALMLSRQQGATSSREDNETIDDDLRLALELSAIQSENDNPFRLYDPGSPAPAIREGSSQDDSPNEDEMLQLAFALSLGQS